MAIPNRIEISSYEELKKIGNDIAYPLVANYELTKDIDAIEGLYAKGLRDAFAIEDFLG